MPDDNLNERQGNPARGLRQRATLPLIIVAALFIIVPFLTWYGTWFGRELSDAKITEYLSDEKNPRHIQHALAQIAERLERKNPDARRWYPQIITLSQSNLAEIRSNSAWVMGKDNQSQEFRAALQRLVNDPEPIVQRNAATALVAFGDAGGRTVLRSMLQSYVLNSPVDGHVDSVLNQGTAVKVGMLLSRIKAADNHLVEVRSPLFGEIESVDAPAGTNVKSGDKLLLISPDSNSVWEALRALYFVGEADDLVLVDRYANGIDKMPEQVKEQAALTAKAIQSRSGKSHQ